MEGREESKRGGRGEIINMSWRRRRGEEKKPPRSPEGSHLYALF